MKLKQLLLVGLLCSFAQLKAQETSSPCETCIRYWPDEDNDGYGDHWAGWAYHPAGGWPGHAANNDDCEDGDSSIQMLYWYIDADGDGFGRAIGRIASCGMPGGASDNNWDCNDHDANLSPNTVWYLDNDHDGLGSSVVAGTQCNPPTNGVLNHDDCNDSDNAVRTALTWYRDTDGDGFGESESTVACIQPNGYVDNNWDQCPEIYGSIMGCVVPNDGVGSHGSFIDLNYIITTIPKKPVTDIQQLTQPEFINTSIVYYDGLGRPVQSIASRETLFGNDIAAHMEYDEQGRLTHEYLQVPTNQNSLAYIPATSLESETVNYYSNNYNSPVPFREKKYEESPLARISKQAFPGTEWKMNSGHEIKTEYKVNTVEDHVKWYIATSEWDPSEELYIPSLTQEVFYPAGQLYKTAIYDENNESSPLDETQGSVIEYKNREGQLVLKRTYGENLDNVTTEAHDTYYVYDQFGNLSYVIPPLADDYDSTTTAIQESLCYLYQYDAKNRLVAKRLPGKTWDYIVYDLLNRPVITGPASSPFTEGGWGWLYTKYDDFNRVCFTGWIGNHDTRHDFQHWYDNNHIYNAIRGQSTIDNVLTGYSSSHIPNDFHLLTVSYYDKYDFTIAPSTLPASVLSQDVLSNAKGLLTGKWVRLLTSETEYKKEESYILYDKKSRVVLNHTTNIDSGYTQTTTLYDFVGQVLRADTEHKKSNVAGPPLRIREDFEYNPQGKLVNHFHKINNRDTELLAHNDYDDLGNLLIKNVGGQDLSSFVGIQKINYQYNIRGWLTSINNVDDLTDNGNDSDLFAFRIQYAQPEGNWADPLYNGNISETYWISSSDNFKRKYSYLYDTMSRLKNGIYENTVTSALYNYDERINYDKNGNISHLLRNGYGDDQGSAYNIDDLDYSYSGTNRNRLMKVDDLTDDPKGFGDDTDLDPADATNDYTYDSWGNMITDDNKGITSITYNHLNLPKEIAFGPATITYYYNAEGRKFLKSVVDGVNPQVNTIYHLGGFQYQNNALQFFPTAEGYVKYVDDPNIADNFGYVYNYLDHLGNIRLSYAIDPSNGQLKILEENHYYPFGLKHMDYSTAKKEHKGEESVMKIKPIPNGGLPEYQYKYNGKEWQDELGLNMYDYGARNYDPAIGRWMNIDPLAEKYFDASTYAYVCNDPVNYIDPDGMDRYYMNEEGKTILALKEDRDDMLFFGGTDNKSIVDTNKDGKQDSKDGITVKTEGLLQQLTQQKGVKTSLFTSTVEQSKTAEDDMLNIFHFAANNTKVEFSLKFYERGGKNLISLGTYNSEWSSPGFEEYGKVRAIKGYHNHPSDDRYSSVHTEQNSMGYYGENQNLSGDSYNAAKNKTTNPNYVFFPKSTNLYNVTKYGIELVKKINGNYKNLKK